MRNVHHGCDGPLERVQGRRCVIGGARSKCGSADSCSADIIPIRAIARRAVLGERAKEVSCVLILCDAHLIRREPGLPQCRGGAVEIGAAGEHRKHVADGIEDVEDGLTPLEECHVERHIGLLFQSGVVSLVAHRSATRAP